MLSNIKALFYRIILFLSIHKVKISDFGIDNDGDPFVQIHNGKIFYGEYRLSKIDKYLYNILFVKYRFKFPLECLRTIFDIIIRYNEGGLKFRGPNKQMYYSVKNGDTVAEMGAYQGFYTMKLSEQVDSIGTIIAIEPNPNNYRLLKKNVINNNLSNVILVNKGVWHEKDILTINVKENDSQSSSIELYNNLKTQSFLSFKINVNTLDNIFSDLAVKNIDFIIIQLNS